ncbi:MULTISPECIES: cupin domain-containing protein [unclassified Leptolyngbya]|uniref:cupin domain-containing protein n=1 Tax=unclassified Leptolyngbya TaxID=2650499 RepID=UPI00168471DF|nr:MULTISPECIES: cupin domain-containing protein [unclassified Leptolyngbya]MBD1913169.1 cupin domain-containing protein [Leptolyngbya sp. FACHB-8]MBD2158792.1 cupin domain-containing protein [Leptolyngbya sp. FACHB-16]
MDIHSIQKTLVQNLSPILTLTTWQNNVVELPGDGTHWGFVYQGNPQLQRHWAGQTFSLYPDMYFCLPGQGSIGGENSCGMVITCLNAEGMFSMGGPVESRGRFAYIDGGANSVLIPPMRSGEPCLNALYFPSGCDQTMHTHPSDRIGVVLNGVGEAETPDRIVQLQPGMLFIIPCHSPHKFRTKNSGLALVVFHPDSDTGFTHRNNPMLNRTLVEGVSAANIPEIQTPLNSQFE